MKNLIVLVLVVAAVWFGGRWAYEKFMAGSATDTADRRVEVVLAGLRGGDEQAAISMFERGVLLLPQEELGPASDRFMDWRSAKGYSSAVSSASVDSVDLSGPIPVVVVTIEGRKHRIVVPPRQRMAWED